MIEYKTPFQSSDEPLRNENIEVTVERHIRRLKDLRKQLQIVAMEQVNNFASATFFFISNEQVLQKIMDLSKCFSFIFLGIRSSSC